MSMSKITLEVRLESKGIKKGYFPKADNRTPPPTFGRPIFFSRRFRTFGAKKIFFFSQKIFWTSKIFRKKISIFFRKMP